MAADRERLSPLPEAAGELPAERAAIGALLAAVERFADDLGLGPQQRVRLRVVLEELATNTLEHGRPAAGSAIGYRLCRRAGAIEITYRDRGRPFDPRSLPAPGEVPDHPPGREGGHGWSIIRSWCRIADYRRDGDANRLLLEMPLKS